MPLYDYICAKCGHEIEVMHSVHDHGPAVCPVCAGPMKKAIVAPAVHFKGSGWARKERSGGAAKPGRSSSESDAGSSGSSSGGSSSDGSGSDGSGSGSEQSSSSDGEKPKAASADKSAKDAD